MGTRNLGSFLLAIKKRRDGKEKKEAGKTKEEEKKDGRQSRGKDKKWFRVVL